MQLIDARDLAAFLLDLAEQRVARRVQRHRADRADDDGRAARRPRATPSCAGSPTRRSRPPSVQPWIELPLWLPEGYAWQVGTERAQAAGLRCRPVAETVADVAAWLRAGGEDELDDWRAEHRPPPMSAEREAELLRAASLPPSRPQ